MGLEDLFVDVSTLPDTGIYYKFNFIYCSFFLKLIKPYHLKYYLGYGFFQLCCFLATYGYILMVAANMIGDGSELLLLVPSMQGLVGSVILPILGAVPDGCIVLFSGMGPNAQEELNVGVGALAGSTIMLLTIPWCLSIFGGRVNVNNNVANYKAPKLSPPDNKDLYTTGVALNNNVKNGAYFMLLTSVSYLIIQLPGWYYLGLSTEEIANDEKSWSLIGFISTFVLFIYYLYNQYSIKDVQSAPSFIAKEEFLKSAIARGDISLLGVMSEELSTTTDNNYQSNKINEQTPLTNKISEESIKRLERLLKPFFKKYDLDNNGTLELIELATVFTDLGESITQRQLMSIFSSMNRGKTAIDYKDFVKGVAEYLMTHNRLIKSHQIQANVVKEHNNYDDDEDEEEDEEIPEDLVSLSPAEQQKRIKQRAFSMMAIGTFIVILVSDPMVAVFSELGVRTGIPAFYISFVLAPLASNLSEVIASYKYALKKTSSSIAISIAALQGAAIMNNTFCLAIFMFLIYSQNLAWEFFAETLSILFVQVVVAFMCFRKVQTLFDGLCILSLYPISLGLVMFLQAIGYD
jgi:Ca2+/Na+ antiporter